jgi:putative membrane protein
MKINNTLRLTMAMAFVGCTSQAMAADASISDSMFLKKAAHSGNFEVQGSQLALKKSKNPEVQKFAKQMVEDHTKANQELKALAMKKKVEVSADPSFMQRGSLMLLGTNDGHDFDQNYADNVGVDAHEATVELFEKAAKNADDAEVKQFASKQLPALKHHLEMARALDKTVDKTADKKD